LKAYYETGTSPGVPAVCWASPAWL